MAKRIVISEIISRLDAGEKRDSINKDLELNPREIKALWSHAALKNKKPAKHSVGIEIVDDITVDYGDLPATRHGYVNGPIADTNKAFE